MNFLAIDLGAESGRALLGRFRAGILEVEVTHRFPNQAVMQNGTLRWDVLRLWHEIRQAIEALPVDELNSIAVDTWGVDYALLGEGGQLLENPYHYRDRRTDGAMAEVFRHLPREAIYRTTGIQFLSFNTIYQFWVAAQRTSRLLAATEAMVTIPDLINYWLTGRLVSEYTNATTTQFLDAHSGDWAWGLLKTLELPGHLLKPIVQPGTILGPLQSGRFAGTPVVVPACHDTGSAVAAISTGPTTAFLSSGTWSLLGAELAKPVITDRARELNFTNEGGVCGTIRLLKNIGGLWLLQSCRRNWAATGREYSYEQLLGSAAGETALFESLIDPDAAEFLNPLSMLNAIKLFCDRTGQQSPGTPGAYAKTILVSLAFKYRSVLESLAELTGQKYEAIRIIGGGAKNRLLNQFTANATGCRIMAGPVEATALGNIAMQMLATGAVRTLEEARAAIERSFPTDLYLPEETALWQSHYRRFQSYLA